jgi:hypothetical protein
MFSHVILHILRNCTSIRQAEIHTVEALVPEPNAFEVELAI